MIVLLNKYSNGGKSVKKWEESKPELEDKYFSGNYTLISDFEDFSKRLYNEFDKGERVIIGAGGDGTINFLLNQIMQMKKEERSELTVGAIGLGSSNDFHKPFSEDKYLNCKVPLRLDCENAADHNVGQVDFEDENGKWNRKYFIINCSIGIIAKANYLFNSKEKVIKWLKSKWVMGTIWYAALRTLFAAKNVPAELKVENKKISTEVTSLSVVINPHVSGNFCYDFNINSQSDYLGVGLCERMGIFARLKTIISLTRGKFTGLPKTRSWMAREVEIKPDSPTPLELDGEIHLARRIKIKLLQGILKISQ
jgi:diacylglycerol kinase family enzyme